MVRGSGGGLVRRRCRRLLACAGALALLGAGPPAPVSLRTLEGGEARVARGEGPPDLVLHFWATWCPECGAELPELERAARACDPARVRVIAVDVDEDAATATRYLADRGLRLDVLIDPGGKAWRAAGLWGLPSNLLWTAEGVTTSEGPSSAKEWRARLAGLGCTGTADAR